METSVYRRKAWLKSGKAVMGLVVNRVLRRPKAVWQTSLQWKTASFRVRHVKERRLPQSLSHSAGSSRLDPGRSGLRWPFWEEGSPEWPPGARIQAAGLPL